MKKIAGLLLAVTLMAAGSVQAVPVTTNYTADNVTVQAGVCVDVECNSIGIPGGSGFSTLFPVGPNSGTWQNADSFTLDLGPGTYGIGFLAQNIGTASRDNPAGLLAEILWDGNENLSSSDWEATIGLGWAPATEWFQNGEGVWGTNLGGEISGNAQWLWTANNFNSLTDEVVGFRTTITVAGAAVPEPSVIALFGLGLLGLGFARRRKA